MEPVVIAIIVGVLVVGVALVAWRRTSGRGGDAATPVAPSHGADADRDRVAGDGDSGGDPAATAVAEPDAPVEPEASVDPRTRMVERLARTRNQLSGSIGQLFGRGVSDEAWEGLEEALIAADVGITASTELVEQVRTRSRAEGATTREAVEALLAEELRAVLAGGDRALARAEGRPSVWLVTGVNGTGKTTSIGKLAAVEAREGRTVVLAAADTFRAAAGEQLAVWGERTGARVVQGDEGADPASVAYAAHDAATSGDADVLIVDTAGRLHNRRELMDELGKVRRVLVSKGGVDETLLVLDATTGQNGIAQARAFLDAVEVTGIVLTKLDGSSRGGIVIAVQRELGIPVRFVGLGEQIDDLAPFDPDLFVEGLLAH
ncbi:MAG: signal recognition particle-docking protein FtsY [Nitriliruptoraceae bacterium]